MGAPVGDRNNLIMAAQTGDAAALSRLLAVCQADARRYGPRRRDGYVHAVAVSDLVKGRARLEIPKGEVCVLISTEF